MRVVLDTNVLVSALAFPESKPDQILTRIRQKDVDLFLSSFILNELSHALQEKFRFGKGAAAARVQAIRTLAHLVEPTERVNVITTKEADNRILECALAAQAEYLVTGDKKHLLPLKTYRNVKIVSPAQFLELLEQ